MIRTRAAASRFLWCPIASFVALVPLTLAMPAAAQSGPSRIPNEAKNANDVTSYKPTVQQFIQQACDQLATGTADQQSKARDMLRSEALVDGQPGKATAAYLNLYAQLLNAQLVPLAQNKEMRVRMNAAIVDWSVAEVVANPQLEPATAAFIGDKSDAVVLWGVKAARWVIPGQLEFGGKSQLLDAIVAAVQAHPSGYTGGAIAYEAYLALTLDIAPRPRTPAMMATVVPYVQKLMELRKQTYINGIAPAPRSESFGSRFLSDGKIWSTLPAAQQVTLMQDFCDLIGLMAQQATAANTADRGDLAKTIAAISSAISIIADPSNVGPVALKIAPATKLDIRSDAATITTDVAAVQAAVRSLAQFKTLATAPVVGGHAAAPPPASAPTTGPAVVPGAIPVPPPSATPPATGTPTTRPHTTVTPSNNTPANAPPANNTPHTAPHTAPKSPNGGTAPRYPK